MKVTAGVGCPGPVSQCPLQSGEYGRAVLYTAQTYLTLLRCTYLVTATATLRPWLKMICLAGGEHMCSTSIFSPHLFIHSIFSPHLGEVARASLARVTELCGAAFWRKINSILLYLYLPYSRIREERTIAELLCLDAFVVARKWYVRTVS